MPNETPQQNTDEVIATLRAELESTRKERDAALELVRLNHETYKANQDALYADRDTALAAKDAAEKALRAQGRLNANKYIEWGYAGGVDDCKHGYGRGIPCPKCDYETVASAIAALTPASTQEPPATAILRKLVEWDKEHPKGRIYPTGPNDAEKQLDAIVAEAKAILPPAGGVTITLLRSRVDLALKILRGADRDILESKASLVALLNPTGDDDGLFDNIPDFQAIGGVTISNETVGIIPTATTPKEASPDVSALGAEAASHPSNSPADVPSEGRGEPEDVCWAEEYDHLSCTWKKLGVPRHDWITSYRGLHRTCCRCKLVESMLPTEGSGA